jgi:hypothetical protein
MTPELDRQAIAALADGLVGQRAWGVHLGFYDHVIIELGQPRPDTTAGRPVGEWHLALRFCQWRVEENGQVLAGGDDSRKRRSQALRRLDNRTVEAVEVQTPAFDLSLRLSGNLMLHTFCVTTMHGYRSWYLTLPNGQVLQIGPAGESRLRTKIRFRQPTYTRPVRPNRRTRLREM